MAKTSTKSHVFSLILFLFLITNFPDSSKARTKLLVHYNPRVESSSSSHDMTQTTLNPKPARPTHRHASATKTSSDRQFRAAAHEVPSGPNPESN